LGCQFIASTIVGCGAFALMTASPYLDLKCEQISVCLNYARELAGFEAAV
jgi:hypothetical protein